MPCQVALGLCIMVDTHPGHIQLGKSVSNVDNKTDDKLLRKYQGVSSDALEQAIGSWQQPLLACIVTITH